MISWLETARMRIRVVGKEDYYQLFADHSDEQLMELLGFDTEAQLEREKQKIALGMCTYRTSVVIFHLLDKETGITMGAFSFHNWYPEHRRSEIGYHTREQYRGKGYMREALASLIPYGFETMNLNRMEAIIAPYNEASQALVKAWQFRQEGLLKEHYMVDGVIEDSLIFGLTRSEYNQIIANKG
jgi:ribosomal-protein-alanine N-acetyltransferase